MTSLTQTQELLTPQNFRRGMLIDDEWLAGVSELKGGASLKPENPLSEPTPAAPEFLAFVVDYLTGSAIGERRFSTLQEALDAVNRLPRVWRFETTQGCGNPECGPGGKCGTQTCPKVARKQAQSAGAASSDCCPSVPKAPSTP